MKLRYFKTTTKNQVVLEILADTEEQFGRDLLTHLSSSLRKAMVAKSFTDRQYMQAEAGRQTLATWQELWAEVIAALNEHEERT